MRCPYCLAPFSATVTSAAERRARPSAPIGPDAVARNVRRCEIISSVAWLVIGVIQCVLVVSLAAGVWNVINAILCLRNVKNIVCSQFRRGSLLRAAQGLAYRSGCSEPGPRWRRWCCPGSL